MKRISCGVLLLDPVGTLLLCHLTGTPYWDIPKGLLEAGESERDAAIREVAEECGIALAPDDLEDLGGFAYRPSKDLHLFATRLPGGAERALRCVSRFTDRWGRVRPEVDDYAWVLPAAIAGRCAPSLTKVLLQLDLESRLELLARGA